MDANVTRPVFTSSALQGGVQEDTVPMLGNAKEVILHNSMTSSSPSVSSLYIKGYPGKEHGYAKTVNDSPVVRPVPFLSYSQQGGNVKISPIQISAVRPAKLTTALTPTVHVSYPHFSGNSSATGLSIASQQPQLRPSTNSISLILDPQTIGSLNSSRKCSRFILETEKPPSTEHVQQTFVAERHNVSSDKTIHNPHTSQPVAALRLKHLPVDAPSQTYTDTCNQQSYQNPVNLPRASRRKQDLYVRKSSNNLSPDHHDEADEWPHLDKNTYITQKPVSRPVNNGTMPVCTSSQVSVTPLAQKLLKILTRDPARCISDSQSLQQMHCLLRQLDCGRKILTAIRDLPDNCIVAEYVGVVKSFEEYDSTCSYQMHYNPYVLFYQVEMKSFCIDASAETHVSRYLNRSCTPNCYMTHVFCEGLPRFVICTREAVALDVELTIGFDFDYSLCQYPVRCVCGRAECPVADSNLQKAYKHSPEFGHASKENKYHNQSSAVTQDRLPKYARKKQRTKSVKNELDSKSISNEKDFPVIVSQIDLYDKHLSLVETKKRSEEVKSKVSSNRRTSSSSKERDDSRKRTRVYSFTDESTDNETEQESLKKEKSDGMDREMRKDLARIRLAMQEEQFREQRRKRKVRKVRVGDSSTEQLKIEESNLAEEDDFQSDLLSPTGSDRTINKKDDEKENFLKELRSPCSTAESSSTTYFIPNDSEILKNKVADIHAERKNLSIQDQKAADTVAEIYIEESQIVSKSDSIFSPQMSCSDNVPAEQDLGPDSDAELFDESTSSSSWEPNDPLLSEHPDMNKEKEPKGKRRNRGRPRNHSKTSRRQHSVSTSEVSTSSTRKRNFEYSDDSSLLRTKRGRAFAEAQRKLFIELERQKKMDKIAELDVQNGLSNREVFLSPTNNDEESHSESDKNDSMSLPEQECSLIVYKSSDANPMAKFSRPSLFSLPVMTEDHEIDNHSEVKTLSSPCTTTTSTEATPLTASNFGTPSTNEQSMPFPFTKKRWLSQAISQQQHQQIEETSVTNKAVESPAENIAIILDSPQVLPSSLSMPKTEELNSQLVAQRQALDDVVLHSTSVSSSIFFGCSPSTNHSSLLVNPKKRLMVQYSELQSQLQEEQEEVEVITLSAEDSNIPRSEESNESALDTSIMPISTESNQETLDCMDTPPKSPMKPSSAPVSKISLKEYKMRRLMNEPTHISTPLPCEKETESVGLMKSPKSPDMLDEDGQPNVSLLSPLDSPPPFIFSTKESLGLSAQPFIPDNVCEVKATQSIDSVEKSHRAAEIDSVVKQAEDMLTFLLENSSVQINLCENSCGPATPSGDEAEEEEHDIVHSPCLVTSLPNKDDGNKNEKQNELDEIKNDSYSLKNIEDETGSVDSIPSYDSVLVKMRQRDDEIRDYQELKVLERQKKRLLQEIISVERSKLKEPASNTGAISSVPPVGMSPVILPVAASNTSVNLSREKRVLLPTPLLPIPQSAGPMPITEGVSTLNDVLPVTLPPPEFLERQMVGQAIYLKGNGKRPLLGMCPTVNVAAYPIVEAGITPTMHFPMHPNDGVLHNESKVRRKRQHVSKEKSSRRPEHGRQHSHRHRHTRRSKRRKRKSSSSSASSSSSSSSSSSGSGISTSSSSSSSSESIMSPEQPGYKQEPHPRMVFYNEPPSHIKFIDEEKFDEYSPNFHSSRQREHTERRFVRPHIHFHPGARGRGNGPYYHPRQWKPHPSHANEYHPFPARGGYMYPPNTGYRHPAQFHSRSIVETHHRH